MFVIVVLSATIYVLLRSFARKKDGLTAAAFPGNVRVMNSKRGYIKTVKLREQITGTENVTARWNWPLPVYARCTPKKRYLNETFSLPERPPGTRRAVDGRGKTMHVIYAWERSK